MEATENGDHDEHGTCASDNDSSPEDGVDDIIQLPTLPQSSPRHTSACAACTDLHRSLRAANAADSDDVVGSVHDGKRNVDGVNRSGDTGSSDVERHRDITSVSTAVTPRPPELNSGIAPGLAPRDTARHRPLWEEEFDEPEVVTARNGATSVNPMAEVSSALAAAAAARKAAAEVSSAV